MLPEQEQLQRLREENRDLCDQKVQLQERMEEEQAASQAAATDKQQLQVLEM